MTLRYLLVSLLAFTGCKSKAADSGDPAPAEPAKPEGPKGMNPPDTVALAPGGSLVDPAPRANGEGIWTYAYPAGEPAALAAKERAALDAKGWKTIVRTEALDGIAPPVRSVFGNLGDKLVVAEAYKGGSGLELKVEVQPMEGLRVQPPPGYPSGFPFLPFGIFQPPKDAASKRITLVYNGELAGLRAEMVSAIAAAGWDCLGSKLESIALCTKAGVEVDVSFTSLSANRQGLFVIPP